MRAMTAATRLTTDSAASDSRPTEPVSRYAPVFSAMVTIAAAIDSHANRSRPAAGGSGSAPTWGNAYVFMAPALSLASRPRSLTHGPMLRAPHRPGRRDGRARTRRLVGRDRHGLPGPRRRG